MEMTAAGIQFHISERTFTRLLPYLSDAPTFAEVKAALVRVQAEDRAIAVADLSPSAIAAGLVKVKAYGPQNGVSTAALADALEGGPELASRLRSLSRTTFAAYCTIVGRDPIWFLTSKGS